MGNKNHKKIMYQNINSIGFVIEPLRIERIFKEFREKNVIAKLELDLS